MHRFVLEAIDPATECVVLDTVLEVESPEDICVQIGIDPTGFNKKARYESENASVDLIKHYFKVDPESRCFRVAVRPWLFVDALPYKVHSNRELAMMLAGTKPLAAFLSGYPANSEYKEIPEELFE